MKFPRKIYAIKHNITKRIYIGSTSQSVEMRYRHHISTLRHKKHSSKLMQKDFNEFGEDYSVYILGDINNIDEKDKEYEFMKEHDTFNPDKGYNQGDRKKLERKSSIKMHLKETLDDLDEH